MASDAPKLTEIHKIEESLLAARLEAARLAITHAGEKGRALEYQVTTFLRSILPGEYGLSTGFVAYHTADAGVQLSSQLDIIIYDALRSAPLVRLETCDVFPLEAVFGSMEVKASLTSYAKPNDSPVHNSIEACVHRAHVLRQMRQRRFWTPTSSVTAGLVAHNWQAIRCYVFAFELIGPAKNDIPALAQAMANESKVVGDTHLHAVFIANQGVLRTRTVATPNPTPSDLHNVKYTTAHPMSAFKNRLLLDLARFPRPSPDWSPALDQYNDAKITWENVAAKS